jgi:hypothetical protein
LRSYLFSKELNKISYIDLNDPKFSLAAAPTANQFRAVLDKISAFCSLKLALLKANCLENTSDLYPQTIKV